MHAAGAFEILLNSDIDDVIQHCAVNQTYWGICHDPHFWQKKFKYDHLPIINQKLEDYYDIVNEYRKVYKAQQHALYLIEDSKKSNIRYIFPYNFEEMHFNTILPQWLKIALFLYHSDTKRFVTWSIQPSNNDGMTLIWKYKIEGIEESLLVDLLTFVFYHYPAIEYHPFPPKY